MFKCTGVCSSCGKCRNSIMTNSTNDRKTKMLSYPEDFFPDIGIGYGMAFDIGTTTVVGMLWNMSAGIQIGNCAKTNPQNEFGMDVISRIDYCGKNGEKLHVLTEKIVECMNEIIKELCDKYEINSSDIYKVAICGNTTMSHIVAGYSPACLSVAPFTPVYTGMLEMSSEEVELNVNEKANIIIVPNIAGHVGGDITAGLVAARVLEKDMLTVFIDVGTNGEIVLTDGKRTFACSTAAGPAFEGSAITHGMRAAIGAIEKIKIHEDGRVDFKTIGECEPQGICGSGLIDAIAQMVSNKLINKKGRLLSVEEAKKNGMQQEMIDRLVEINGERNFILVAKTSGDDITITQNDIREVQLAKGAISAGIKMMLDEMGKKESDIENVVVAGAFGNYIDKVSALTIGLLPQISETKIVSAGNAAGSGISMALVSGKELEKIKNIPEKVKHIELAEKESFQMIYLKAMAFK